jgi:hypothetical protein
MPVSTAVKRLLAYFKVILAQWPLKIILRILNVVMRTWTAGFGYRKKRPYTQATRKPGDCPTPCRGPYSGADVFGSRLPSDAAPISGEQQGENHDGAQIPYLVHGRSMSALNQTRTTREYHAHIERYPVSESQLNSEPQPRNRRPDHLPVDMVLGHEESNKPGDNQGADARRDVLNANPAAGGPSGTEHLNNYLRGRKILPMVTSDIKRYERGLSLNVATLMVVPYLLKCYSGNDELPINIPPMTIKVD